MLDSGSAGLEGMVCGLWLKEDDLLKKSSMPRRRLQYDFI
jgi:hypothetical protein